MKFPTDIPTAALLYAEDDLTTSGGGPMKGQAAPARKRWERVLRKRERKDLQAAERFFCACRDGRADALPAAAQELYGRTTVRFWWEVEDPYWRLAMEKVAQLPMVSAEIQRAFIKVWAETYELPRMVGDRHIMAQALRLLMPGNYRGPPLTLYRGAESYEWRNRTFSFSWSLKIEHAAKFTIHQIIADEYPVPGYLFKTVAPPESVLLVRGPDSYSDDDEAEVVIDPFRLGEVTLIGSWTSGRECRAAVDGFSARGLVT
jgi:hypothetical protein